MRRQRLGGPAVKPDVIDQKEELRPVTEGERRERDFQRIKARRDFALYVVSQYVFATVARAAERKDLNWFEKSILVECDNAVIEQVCHSYRIRGGVEIAIERRAELRVTMPPTGV